MIKGHFTKAIASKGILNFGPWSTKIGGTVRATKKMTHIDNRPGPSRNYGETQLRFAETRVLAQKWVGGVPTLYVKYHEK